MKGTRSAWLLPLPLILAVACGGSKKCKDGLHDGGGGQCVATGTCASGYHDAGDGTCTASGCLPTFLLAPAGCRAGARVATTPGASANGAVGLNAAGTVVYAAWLENTSVGGARLYFAQAGVADLLFSTAIDVAAVPVEYYGRAYPTIAARSDGAILLLEFDGTGLDEGVCSGSWPMIYASTDSGQTFATASITRSPGYYQLGRSFAWNGEATRFGALPMGQYTNACRELNALELAYYETLDFGATWQKTVLAPAGGIARGRPALAFTASGVVVVAWLEASSTSRVDVEVRYSVDGGATFLPPNTGGTLTAQLSAQPDLPLLRAYGEQVMLYFSAGGANYMASSVNGGASFTAPSASPSGSGPGVRMLGAGHMSRFSVGNNGITCSASTDWGQTYTAAVTVSGPAALLSPQAAAAQAGGASGPLLFAWSEGGDIYVGKVNDACR